MAHVHGKLNRKNKRGNAMYWSAHINFNMSNLFISYLFNQNKCLAQTWNEWQNLILINHLDIFLWEGDGEEGWKSNAKLYNKQWLKCHKLKNHIKNLNVQSSMLMCTLILPWKMSSRDRIYLGVFVCCNWAEDQHNGTRIRMAYNIIVTMKIFHWIEFYCTTWIWKQCNREGFIE